MNCNINCNSPYITGSKNSSAQAINKPTRNIAVYSCQKEHTEKRKKEHLKCYAMEPDNQLAELWQEKLKLNANVSRSFKGTFR